MTSFPATSKTDMRRPAGLICLLAAVGLWLFVAADWRAAARAASQEPLSSSEGRGKQIYVKGTSPSGKEIFAYLGESSLEVPGSSMPCANCHGLDGKGKPEAGVIPSNLTSEALTKPYGLTHAGGRKHPPYTQKGLEIAITRGIDPAGNKLGSVMPRYSMSRDDLADLVSYLGRLGKDTDPGISEDRISIGTAVPASGALAEMGHAVKAVTAAFFDELNSQGGIYNRRFELKVAEISGKAGATRGEIEQLLRSEQVFAMTGAVIPGSEREVFALMAEREVPLIGPFTLYPETGFPLNRQVFYLLSGIEGQGRTLVHFAANKPELKNRRMAIVSQQSEINTSMVRSLKEQSKKDGLAAMPDYTYPLGQIDTAGLLKQLRQSPPDLLFFLGSGEDALSLMREAARSNWFPYIFLLSVGGSAEILSAPLGFNGKLFIPFPTSPVDQTSEGLREYRELAAKYRLPARHLAAQLSAYSAAKVLAEAFRRAGRDVSREKLIDALEGLYEYPTGLTPAITYGANRRIGAKGAYVVTIDLEQKQFLPAGGWLNID
jgi:ABC-type branched-subunit amino acid transport system substrate-binding protein